MSTTFANTIDNNPIYAQRAEQDAAGHDIQQTYATKAELPAAQVQSDWDATTGMGVILNKPTLATVATTGDYDDLTDKPDLSIYAQSSSLATVATTGAYSDLSGTPTINNVPAVTSSDDDKVLKASYSGGVGSYSWETAPSGQVNSDWEATSGVAEILNKPDLVDIVAGPGIVVDNPDGNTLRVSQYDPTVDVVRDCENWNGHTMKCIILRGAYTTNTSMQNQYIENVLPVGTTIAFIDGSNSYVVYGGNPQINMMVPYCIDNNRLFSPWVDITNRRVNLRYIDVSNNLTCTYYLCVKYAVD